MGPIRPTSSVAPPKGLASFPNQSQTTTEFSGIS
jgi:hypothetical protein